MRMTIGKLKHRILFQENVVEVGANGFEENCWTNIKEVWGSVSNLQGKEYYQAASVQKENTVKFLIRYTPGISQEMRIKFNDCFYDIISINNLNYVNRYIEIKAIEVESDDEN